MCFELIKVSKTELSLNVYIAVLWFQRSILAFQTVKLKLFEILRIEVKLNYIETMEGTLISNYSLCFCCFSMPTSSFDWSFGLRFGAVGSL